MGGRSSSRARKPESMMADEKVNTGDENKWKTVCDDEDESGDEWFDANDEMAEYAQSDKGGTDEASGQEDMQISDKWGRRPCEEDCDIGSTESVAEYKGGTDEASVHDDMQSSSAKCSHPSVEDNAIGSIQIVAEYAQSDERGTGEASNRDDIQSSSDKLNPPSVEDCAMGSIQLDDVDNTLGQNRQSIEHIRTDLWNKLTSLGPQKTAEYIKQHLDRWKTTEVRFAVAGKTETGKSTFINTIRGIEEGQDGYADVGFGDQTGEISEYQHPVNKNIFFCDLPGFSAKFTEDKFLKMVNLSKYSYIFIFFESVLSEQDKWLTVQIQEKGIPFCLIRSKVDTSVESRHGKKIGEADTLLQIRAKIKDSIPTNTALAKAELFLISSEKPHIGEMSNLQDHMKEKLPSIQFTAVMFSLPILTERVIEKKLIELAQRIPYVSTGAAIIAAFPIPFIGVPINLALITVEVQHYVEVFGLDRTHKENIADLKTDFSVVSVEEFVIKRIRAKHDIFSLVERSIRGTLQLVLGSISAGHETKIDVEELLSDVLSELTKDAITMYMYFLNKDRL